MKILSKTCMAGLIAMTMSMSSYAEKVLPNQLIN